MNRLVVAVASGLLFGLGLALSGMSDPAKVLAFLDVTGAWDPSLALVMVGAIAIHAPVVHWVRRRGRPWIGGPLRLPAPGPIDRRLIAGAAVFGVGWGLVGYCPGPVVLAAAALQPTALLVLAGTLAGMAAVGVLRRGTP